MCYLRYILFVSSHPGNPHATGLFLFGFFRDIIGVHRTGCSAWPGAILVRWRCDLFGFLFSPLIVLCMLGQGLLRFWFELSSSCMILTVLVWHLTEDPGILGRKRNEDM